MKLLASVSPGLHGRAMYREVEGSNENSYVGLAAHRAAVTWVGKVGGLWVGEGIWLLLRVLSSLLGLLHQVLATDFQFAKQNKFALIRKTHRKDCLDFNAAARAFWIPSLQEALLTLMPSQACYYSLETVTSARQRFHSWPQAAWPFLPESWKADVEGGVPGIVPSHNGITPRKGCVWSEYVGLLCGSGSLLKPHGRELWCWLPTLDDFHYCFSPLSRTAGPNCILCSSCTVEEGFEADPPRLRTKGPPPAEALRG